MSAKDQPFVVRMPVELHAALKDAAARDDRSMAQAIRYAIRRYIDTVPEVQP